jgi:protein-S-isoprenylcysteine O-methyltransferase Ste14
MSAETRSVSASGFGELAWLGTVAAGVAAVILLVFGLMHASDNAVVYSVLGLVGYLAVWLLALLMASRS